MFFFFFSSRRRHTRLQGDWSSDVCSSDLILRIHGGPVSQFQYEFSHLFQVLAAHGYVVVVANPRGSSGRGQAYATAIYADWGDKDAQDVLGAVDYAVSQGLADPARLGVGGGGYGGVLTH